MSNKIYLVTTDCTMNYPHQVILSITAEEAEEIQQEINGTLSYVSEFTSYAGDIFLSSNAIVGARDITDEVELLLSVIVHNRVCRRCRGLLLFSFVPDYMYQCVHHNEDLYEIETAEWEGKFNKTQIQRFLEDFYSQNTISIDDVRQWKKTWRNKK